MNLKQEQPSKNAFLVKSLKKQIYGNFFYRSAIVPNFGYMTTHTT